MELPVYIDGEQAGTLTLERAGAACCRIQARLEDRGRVVRLWLYGDGALYLGVPEPEEGQLVLRRCLRGRDMEALPAHPAYGAEKPRAPRRVLWHGGRAHYF
jgi:hypothetical protein